MRDLLFVATVVAFFAIAAAYVAACGAIVGRQDDSDINVEPADEDRAPSVTP